MGSSNNRGVPSRFLGKGFTELGNKYRLLILD